MEHIDDTLSDQLDQYLRGEMSPAERSDFEGLLAENPALQAALSERRDLVRGICDAVWSDLRLAMDEELDAMEREERDERLRRWRKIGLWVGAVLLAGLWLGWLWFLEEKNPPVPLPVPEGIAFENSTKLGMEKSTWFTFHIDSAKQVEFKFGPDTALIQKKEANRPTQRQALRKVDKPSRETRPDTTQTKPIAKLETPKKDSSIKVATPENRSLRTMTQLPARRVLASAGQKTGEELLPAIPLTVRTDTAMQCVFLGSELRLFVSPDFAEGQPIEIVQLRGAGLADGHYLKVGPQIYPMKNDRGHPFRLEPLLDAATLRLLLE